MKKAYRTQYHRTFTPLACRVHRQQQMDAFIPAQAVAPADIRQAGQPARTTALGIAGRHPGAVEGFIGTALSGQELDEMQKKRHQGRVLLAELPIVLLPGGQRRKGGPEMALRIAIKAPLTAKALPLPEQGQGHHLTPAQGCLGARVWLGGQRGLAKVVCHHVQNSQEGVHIDHRSAPIVGKIEQFYRLGAPSG